MNAVNPNRTARAITLIAVVTAGLLAASCGSLTQPSPEKASFAIDPGNPPPTMASRQTMSSCVSRAFSSVDRRTFSPPPHSPSSTSARVR